MLDIDRRVSESLGRIRDAHTDSYRSELPTLRDAIIRRTRRRRASMGLVAAATIVAVVAAVVVLPTTLGDRDKTGPASGERTLIKIPTGAPSHLAASGNNVWLVSPTELRRIDAETNRLGTLVQGFTPENVSGLAADQDIVWVVRRANRFGVIGSIDASGRGLQEIGRFNTDLVAVDVADGYVWGADGVSSAVWKIDPRTGSYIRPYGTGIEWRLEGAVNLAAGHGYLWLQVGERLVRIDPEAPEGAAGQSTISGENGCAGLAVGEGAVWVVDSCKDVVTRYDPGTLKPTATIESDGRDFGDRITAGLGSLWVTGDSVTRIDPGANRIVGPPIEVAGGASEIAVGAGSLWMATPHGVLRYTPEGATPSAVSPGEDVAYGSALGMWPEITVDEATGACDRHETHEEYWRTDPRRLVARFAKLELFLQDVTVQEVDDSVGRTLRIVSPPNFLPTSVRVRRVPRTPCWVVATLDPTVDGMAVTQDLRSEGKLILDVMPPLAVHNIAVELGQMGRPLVNVAAHPSDFPIEIDGYRHGAPGYLLVRFNRDSQLVAVYAELLD